MSKIPFKNFNLGGISDSDYQGANNSLATLWGFDIHNEPGVLKVNQALTKDSGTTITELCLASVACSNGNTYFFGSVTGKVWKRTYTGVYSLAATVSPAAGSAGILGAKEYNGYIYWATEKRVGRWDMTATDWGTIENDFATFTKGNSALHPMFILNKSLYIGDSNLIAEIDNGVFTANALDIGIPYLIKCLGRSDDELLIGTWVSNNIMETRIFCWNTWSTNPTYSDPIPEVGINAFLPIDNGVMVSAGSKGNIYIYDGKNLDLYKQIKGSWSNSSKGIVNPNAILNFNGLPLFGLSYYAGGNPTNMGIYSLGRANRNYPTVLNGEYGISTGHLSNVEIGCIVPVSDEYFLVAWKDTSAIPTVYGVDKLDISNKYSGAYLETRNIIVDRMNFMTFKSVEIAYRLLPANTTFTISRKVNNGSYEDFLTTECSNDIDRAIFASEIDINNATKIKIKISPTISVNNSPEIEEFNVNVE